MQQDKQRSLILWNALRFGFVFLALRNANVPQRDGRVRSSSCKTNTCKYTTKQHTIEHQRTEEPGLVLGVEHQAAQVVEVTGSVRSTGAELFVAEQLLGVEQLDVAVVAAHRQNVRLLPVDLQRRPRQRVKLLQRDVFGYEIREPRIVFLCVKSRKTSRVCW